MIDAWIAVINNPEKSKGKTFTIGPNNAIQIEKYAELIGRKLGWQGEIVWHSKPARPGEIYWLNSDCCLIESTLGWKPKIDLDTGLDLTIDIWQPLINKKSIYG